MMRKIENLKDYKPFLILFDAGGFQEFSYDPLSISGGNSSS